MNCPTCKAPTENHSEDETMLGYSIIDIDGVEHHHNDNCLKRYYYCVNGHNWRESIQRRCKHGDWVGKDSCFCHPGKKVEKWTDPPHTEAEARMTNEEIHGS